MCDRRVYNKGRGLLCGTREQPPSRPLTENTGNGEGQRVGILTDKTAGDRAQQSVSDGQDGRAAEFCENHAFRKIPSNPPQDVGVRGIR